MTNTNSNKGWTTITLNNGRTLEGVVTTETDTHVSLYKLPYPIAKKNIANRSERRIVLTTQAY
jgi:hypothetical protein